jgi:hypothetical protein
MYSRWRDSPHSKHSPASGKGVWIIIFVEAVTKRSRAQGYADLAHFTWSRNENRRSVIAHSSAANNSKNYGRNYRVLPLRVLLLIFREVLSQRNQVFSCQLQALAQLSGIGHILRGVDYEFLKAITDAWFRKSRFISELILSHGIDHP